MALIIDISTRQGHFPGALVRVTQATVTRYRQDGVTSHAVDWTASAFSAADDTIVQSRTGRFDLDPSGPDVLVQVYNHLKAAGGPYAGAADHL